MLNSSFAEFPLVVPRHAFSSRDAARAGDVWRAFQEVAVHASTLAGWPPERYRAEGAAFVVRGMRVVHRRELRYGEPTVGQTWVSRVRKGFLSTREVRLVAGGEAIAAATQEWVHVRADVSIAPASAALIEAFPPEVRGDDVPALDRGGPVGGPERSFEFGCWHTWMDPLAHANHPVYVDWCEEAIARVLHGAGIDPARVVPVAEEAAYRSAVVAPDAVCVKTRPVGRTSEGALVFQHEVLSRGEIAAKVTMVRRLDGDDGVAMASAFEVEA
ncbi:MAG: hotdog domain-containing protein [Polyangiales bacterium]|nr:hypothetical protein [Myxococcales bacterium]